MRRVVSGSLYLAVGALAGVGSAVGAIEIYGAVPVAPESPWMSFEVSPNSPVQPYAVAHFLMAGRLPPALGQMREFTSQRSSDGGVLSSACDYELVAAPAPAQWWSLSASGGGKSEPDTVITADMAIAENDGSVRVVVSRNANPGNWIRPPAGEAFTLTYMVAEASTSQAGGVLPAFAIARSRC
ncbi:MAG: DUF1214 domain-containing protein [Rhizobiales bacterium]|nr:DUF1214 domain-containing protein [Hyphomicrobiales bacterium]MBI3674853.1 DUF1214 domain-containing protein [Hyphomicrobiales bacterium]